MTKRISLSIYIDGTGNNKTNDAASPDHNSTDSSNADKRTNVAKIHELQQADESFDFSRNGIANTSDEFKSGVEGGPKSFNDFMENLANTSSDEQPTSIKLYHDGVGSQPEKPSVSEAAFGAGTNDRIQTMVESIKQVREAYGPDVIIDLNVVGFSRGSAACKALLNRLADEYGGTENFQLATVVLFDPVVSIDNPLSDTHAGLDMAFPEALINENTRIYEAIAANEERETFSLSPYQDARVFQQMFPGAHAQIGGGYHNDILAVGPLNWALDKLSNGSDQSYKSTEMPIDSVIKLRMYNAVIENPLLVRILTTDSRIKSYDLKKEGTSKDSDGKDVEGVYFEGTNSSVPSSVRHIVNERESLIGGEGTTFITSELDRISNDIFDDIIAMMDSGVYEEQLYQESELFKKYGGGDLSFSSIDDQNYSILNSSSNSEQLPYELELIVQRFENQIDSISYLPADLENYPYLKKTIEKFQQSSADLLKDIQDFLVNAEMNGTVDAHTIEAAESLLANADVLDTRTGKYAEHEETIENEIRTHTNILINREVSIAYLDELKAADSLKQAIEEGDEIAIAQTITDYLIFIDNLWDKTEYENSRNVLYGRKDNEDAGIISENNEVLLSAVSSGISLLSALNDGDTLQKATATLKLIQNIDYYIDVSAGPAQDGTSLSPNDTGLSSRHARIVNTVTNVLRFAQAVEDGDELETILAGAELLDELDNIEDLTLGKLSSFVSLYRNISSFDEILASGKPIEIGLASAEIANDAITSYNTIATTTKALDEFNFDGSSDLGAIVAGVQLGTGDAKGAALSTLTNQLLTSGNTTQMCIGAGIQIANAVGVFDNETVNDSLDNTLAQAGLNYYVCTNSISGFTAATVQAADGDTEGSIITAATTGLLATGSAAGYIAAAFLQIVRASYLRDHPPNADVFFGIDENGDIKVEVSGDSEMKDTATTYGNALVSIIENYRDSGGRIMIDGTMPRLKVFQGKPSEILYEGFSGGKISIIVNDFSQAPIRMRGALIARDHGERLQSAVTISRDIHGNIDLSKVGAIMRGHGFTKRGDNYIFGETREIYGTATGTGVYRGGGQTGPEGKYFVANSSNIKSLPIPADQLPSQKMGEISRIVSLKNIFSGSGAELLAMSLMLQGGVSVFASNANAGQITNQQYEDYIHPLTGNELEEYLISGNIAQPKDALKSLFKQESFPDISDPDSLQMFLSQHWTELLNGYDWEIDSLVDTTHHFKENIGYNGLLNDGSIAPWWNKDKTDLFFENQLDESNKSFTGQPISLEDLDDLGASLSLANNFEIGAAFNMAEDSVMRFLLSDITENSLSSQYGNTDENYSFVSFGSAQNGKVWTDVNGDIRFEPTPGFVGTASFLYTIESTTGELIEKQAVVVVQNVNDAPTLQNDSFSLSEGTIFYLDRLLNNDSDIDGDILKIDHFRGVENGEVSLINGRLAFTPDTGFFGNVEFSYWVRDHIDTYPVMATVSLQYQDVNSGATTEDDRFVILEDTSLSTTVDTLLANDIEYDGEQISFVELGSATNGTVQLLANGEILFTPDTNYVGKGAGFHYKVKDESGNITKGWASVEVHDSREIPVVTSTTRAAINEDEILTFSPAEVAKFIYDADGDSMHLEMITNVSGGSITIKDGYYTFVPDANYSGQASFDYRAGDNHGGTVDGNLTFDIAAVNDAIDTGEDILATTEEQSVTTTVTDLMVNDTDVDGNEFDFVALGSTTNSTVNIDATNTIIFTPDPDYFGEDAGFEYIVSDSEGLQTTGWVQVKVENVNDAPEIIGNTLSTQEDTAIVFDANSIAPCFTDVDGDFLQIIKVEAESGGVVTLENFKYILTPDLNYNGDGSVRITVSDGNGGEITESVEINILAQNDAAIVGEDTLNTDEEQSVGTTVASLLANDSDVDGTLEFKALGDVFHGSVILSDLGEILFTPEDNYFGTDAGYEYIVEDPAGNEATGRVKVEVVNTNDPPQIISTSISTNEDEKITFSAETISNFIQDIDGDAISLTSIDEIEGGTVLNDNGVYTFTPDNNYHGAATLSYTAENTTDETLTGKLDITILSQNDTTNFGDDSATVQEDQVLLTSVTELLANDSDNDGALTFSGLGGAKFGEVVLAQDGSITFTPDKDYQGAEAGFCYAVIDVEGNEAEGWVSVQVDNVNDEPVITGNRIHLQEDESLAFTSEEISRFLYDADGEFYNLDMVANVEGGRLELAGGVYTFIPDADYYGEASFDYIAKNGNGESIDSTMHLAISPVNDLPLVQMTSATGTEDNEILLKIDTLMAGASDVEDGTSLKFGGIDSSLHGDVYVDKNGSVHFLPDKDYFGNAAFRYDVIDSEGGISKGYVTLDIAGENDAPVAMDDEKIVAWSNNMYENVYMASALLANDIDVDFDPLKIISVGSAEYGTVSVDSAGNIKYIATSDEWVGIDTFTYTITDGNGETSQATAKLDVKINTSPDVYPELFFTKEDNVSIIKQADLLANDSDVDSDSIQIIAVDQAERCAVEIMANGDIKFTPELNFNNKYPGQASFRYTVSDGVSTPAVAVAFFDIDPVNDAPILRPERIDGAVEDNSFSFTVDQIMANDTDVEMESQYEEDSISFVEVFNAGHGTISSDETGTVFYTPDLNFCGVETFQYKVIDSYGAESIIESEIWVEPVNDKPEVQEDVSTKPAEDYIPNYYSIKSLVANDFDVDGDTLTIKAPTVIAGKGTVKVSGGNLVVTPQLGEDYMEVQYTVTDGNGGDVISKLTIPQIKPHNFAPEFTGLYRIISHSVISTTFSFHVSDRNGGDNWTITGGQHQVGDIVSISAGSLHTNYSPNELKELSQYGHFSFFHWPSAPGASLYANFTLTAVDRLGASSTILVNFMDMNWTVGNHHYPVILDLDSDGVELISANKGLGFDWNGDGEQEVTGWAGKDDGFLVYDYDGDKQVTQANEIALKEYHPDAKTDLEGLKGFDSNNNGLFDVNDEKWQEFGVWQDKNSNGITDDGEFSTLDEQGIVSIDLQSDENYREQNDNVVYGATTYQKSDGSVHEVLDVGLNGEMIEATEVESPNEFISNSPGDASGTLISPDEAETPNSFNTETELTGNTLTDAELDRQFIQMQSDLATNPATENETQNVTVILSDAPLDGQSILGEQDQEYQIA